MATPVSTPPQNACRKWAVKGVYDPVLSQVLLLFRKLPGSDPKVPKCATVKIPPVVQFLAVAAAMWLIAKYAPALSVAIPARRALVILFFCIGGAVAIPGIAAFRAAGTTVDPRYPEKASRLVASGIYGYSRNPMYLGLLCLLIAWALYLSNLLGFAGLPAFVLAMNRLQIRREEAAMEALFGDEYRAYRQKVRRWI